LVGEPIGAGAAVHAVLAGGAAPHQQLGPGPGGAGELPGERGLGHRPPAVGRRIVGDPTVQAPQQPLSPGPDELAAVTRLQAAGPACRAFPSVAGRVVDPVGVDPLGPQSTKTSLHQRRLERRQQRWPALADVHVRFRTRFAYVDGELEGGGA
jgi:hypothetical protein